MKETLTTNQIADAIHAVYDGANFTRAGAYALAEYLEEYENDTGEELELDPIAFACEYAEYTTLVECVKETVSDDEQANLKDGDGFNDDLIRDYLNENSTLVEFDGGLIIRSF